jgi:hypothetical protein
MCSIYRKPSFFSSQPQMPDATYPVNMFFQQRICEKEWNEFCDNFESALQATDPADLLMAGVITIFAVLAFFIPLGYVIFILVCLILGWYRAYRRRSFINAIYSGIAHYNKYLFRPRGIQLRIQVKCGNSPITTSSVKLENLSLKIEIAHPPTRASLSSSFPDMREESRRALRHKSVNSTDGYIDFYEKKLPSSILCLPPVNVLLDESKVCVYQLSSIFCIKFVIFFVFYHHCILYR